jgi:hypothetical protein
LSREAPSPKLKYPNPTVNESCVTKQANHFCSAAELIAEHANVFFGVGS